jgi:exosortase K
VTSKLLVIAAALLAMWGLKRHYADAGADELKWILYPTARVVSVVTRAEFAMESGQGYLSRERRFLIEKSCAGINFMIAAFGMLTFASLSRVASLPSGLRVLIVSLAASYAAAVAINAVRIAIAMWLADQPVAIAGMSAADIHRVEGITVYFGGLAVVYELGSRS